MQVYMVSKQKLLVPCMAYVAIRHFVLGGNAMANWFSELSVLPLVNNHCHQHFIFLTSSSSFSNHLKHVTTCATLVARRVGKVTNIIVEKHPS